MVLYPFILIKSRYMSIRLFKHELIHVYQIEEKGVFKFYADYIRTYFKTGYLNHPDEIEAYKRETEPLTQRERRWFKTGRVNLNDEP